MKRLLCIISCMNIGGAETFLMKIYRQLDKTKYQMDFCINVLEKSYYEDEILALGGKVYRIPSKSENLRGFVKGLTQVVREGQYDQVLRVTSNAMGFLDLMVAKKAGAKRCIARSSNSSDGGSMLSRVSHIAGRLLLARYVDVKIAPSDLAAEYTFGKKAYYAGNVSILHNGVDLDAVHYDKTAAQSVKEELGISSNQRVFGHVGRFDLQKNHGFLLEVFREIHNSDPGSVLLLVGTGALRAQITAQADKLGIAEHVIFAGARSDIPAVMSAMDVFVFPSLYEGMPNTVIEAQAVGLPCVIADTITKEADITGCVEYLPLGDPCRWAQRCMQAACRERIDTRTAFVSKRYDIQSVAEEFTKLVFGEKI